MQPTLRVKGLREFIRAADASDKETKKRVRDHLRRAAEPVRVEAQRLFTPIDARSASRYGISVRRTGSVAVEQRLRKTTGLRPDFGRLQMRRALEPALEAKSHEVERELEKAVDELADVMEG